MKKTNNIDDQLIIECKKGLNMSADKNELIDPVIEQKILTVKSFMKGSGVSDEVLEGDGLSIGVIVLGVLDLWDLKAGEVKFSPAFYTLLTQLSMR